MTSVWVKTQGQRSIRWAAFRLEIDAHNYADKLRAEHPDWSVEVSRSLRPHKAA